MIAGLVAMARVCNARRIFCSARPRALAPSLGLAALLALAPFAQPASAQALSLASCASALRLPATEARIELSSLSALGYEDEDGHHAQGYALEARAILPLGGVDLSAWGRARRSSSKFELRAFGADFDLAYDSDMAAAGLGLSLGRTIGVSAWSQGGRAYGDAWVGLELPWSLRVEAGASYEPLLSGRFSPTEYLSPIELDLEIAAFRLALGSSGPAERWIECGYAFSTSGDSDEDSWDDYYLELPRELSLRGRWRGALGTWEFGADAQGAELRLRVVTGGHPIAAEDIGAMLGAIELSATAPSRTRLGLGAYGLESSAWDGQYQGDWFMLLGSEIIGQYGIDADKTSIGGLSASIDQALGSEAFRVDFGLRGLFAFWSGEGEVFKEESSSYWDLIPPFHHTSVSWSRAASYSLKSLPDAFAEARLGLSLKLWELWLLEIEASQWIPLWFPSGGGSGQGAGAASSGGGSAYGGLCVRATMSLKLGPRPVRDDRS